MITRRALLAALWPADSCAVALRVRDGEVVRWEKEKQARGSWAAPGSTVKPLALGAMKRWESVPCGRKLEIGGRELDCTHTPLTRPPDAETALAASCNVWFAEMARRADPREVRGRLLECGAQVELARTLVALQLQVLGIEGVRFTPFALALAYRRLALGNETAIRRGLERAVKEGTAQRAAPTGMTVAGKTGTTNDGAWFAGYADGLAVTVFLEKGSGGGDAAPLARGIFEWWRDSAQLH